MGVHLHRNARALQLNYLLFYLLSLRALLLKQANLFGEATPMGIVTLSEVRFKTDETVWNKSVCPGFYVYGVLLDTFDGNLEECVKNVPSSTPY